MWDTTFKYCFKISLLYWVKIGSLFVRKSFCRSLYSGNIIIMVFSLIFIAIISSPDSTNVSLAARVTNFSCLCIGERVHWKQDKNFIDFGHGQDFDVTMVVVDEAEHLRMSTLTVNISVSQNKYNNTYFSCVASVRHVILADSDPALLRIQGINYYSPIIGHLNVYVCNST